MEVLSSNFNEKLPDVLKAIEDSEFLAIDGEMTGVNGDVSENAWDMPAERYRKVAKGSVGYLLCQFGISAFKLDQKDKKYISKSYKFYIFPRSSQKLRHEPKFNCQASSIQFLVSHGFDFAKLFREGISFLSLADEQKLRERLAVRRRSAKAADSPYVEIDVPDNQSKFMEDVQSQISSYMLSSETEAILLPPCNSFQRRLVYQFVSSRYPVGLFVETAGEGRLCPLSIKKVSEEELKVKKVEKKSSEEDELESLIGFSRVIRAISSSGKLVVGHNMLLDMLQFVNSFCYPLPDSLDDFKAMVKDLLPRVVDTKVMASTAPFKDYLPNTSLEDVYKGVHAAPFIAPPVEVADGFPGFAEAMYHDAAFDAYATGCCFVGMVNFLGKFMNPAVRHVSPSSTVVEPFVNKVNLFRIFDIPYLNLAGPDVEPKRDNVYHAEFPEEWKTSNVKQVFSRCGNVQVTWATSTTAFVTVQSQDPVAKVMKTIDKSSNCRVTPFTEWYKEANGRATGASVTVAVCVERGHSDSPDEVARLTEKSCSATCASKTPDDQVADGHDIALPTPLNSDCSCIVQQVNTDSGGSSLETIHLSPQEQLDELQSLTAACPNQMSLQRCADSVSPPSKKRKQLVPGPQQNDVKVFEEPDW